MRVQLDEVDREPLRDAQVPVDRDDGPAVRGELVAAAVGGHPAGPRSGLARTTAR